ncbi:MAG TPA: phosphatase PAP2 family protein, partial [Terriglobales bacterium]|nr:phosphatase PAP2 family protein [Terriglobales bacterium]
NCLRQRRLANPFLLNNRRIIFLLLALALGPGLLVNVVLKSHWGRARPIEVSAFGGLRDFSPAYVIAKQCRHNCSFVSGDAAMGYYLMVFLFIARKRAGAVALGLVGVLTGSVIGLVRIAQGAHFLSDVIFAGLLTVTVAWLLSMLMLRRDEEAAVIFLTDVAPGVISALAPK